MYLSSVGTKRFLLPAGVELTGAGNYGQQYIGWHIVETRSALEAAPNELSLYATESYWTGKSSALRRYTLRMDGFVSVNASMQGGEIVTKPVQFQGNVLCLNFSSSAAGDVRVEVQDAQGKAIPGFALDDCLPLFGDSPDARVNGSPGPMFLLLPAKPFVCGSPCATPTCSPSNSRKNRTA